MVEVFKTDVTSQQHADMLLGRIHDTFTDHIASFDLEDCDNILRVKCSSGPVRVPCLISLLKELGFHAEALPDEIPL